MALEGFHCLHCGASLEDRREDGTYHCRFCDHVFRDESLQKEVQTLEVMFEGILLNQKDEQIANIRRNLWEAVHDKYISSEKVVSCCREMKKLLPDDFQANFYEIANSGTAFELNRYLDDIDVLENDIYIVDAVEFLINSLDSKNILSVKSLIERAKSFGVLNSTQYTDLLTRVEEEAEKLENGIYSTILPRDVFVAYSSADMAIVNEIVDFLEENEISCFTAVRNLRHGRGAKENYHSALQSAIHNCKCVVFLSSNNSRRLACDALSFELPYIRDHEPKMGRIQYLIDEDEGQTTKIVKMLLDKFFEDKPTCSSKDDLLLNILEVITDSTDEKLKASEEMKKQKAELERRRLALEEFQKKQDEEYLRQQEELARQQQDEYQKQQEELAKKQREELERIKNELAMKSKPSTISLNTQFYDRNKFKILGTTLEEYKGDEIVAKIPEGVTEIAESAFKESDVNAILIPDSVLYIGDKAFEGCKNLEVVYIPDTVADIGSDLFSGCKISLIIFTPLKERPDSWRDDFDSGCTVVWNSIGLPEDIQSKEERDVVTKIKADLLVNAFSGVYQVKHAEEAERLEKERFELEKIEQECLAYEKEQEKQLAEQILAKQKLDKKLVRKLFEIVGSKLVSYKGNEESVVIPDGIETIEEGAFIGCESILEIVFPKSIKRIEKDAFRECESLNAVYISSLIAWCQIDFMNEYSNPCFYAHNLYLNGNLIRELTIPATIKNLKPYSFSGCRINKVILSKGIESINRTFSQSIGLNNVELPTTLKAIGDFAFEKCEALFEITIPEGATKVGISAFSGCKYLSSVIFPSTLKSISESAFANCKSLTDLILPEGLTTIDGSAFLDCSNLIQVSLPSTIKSIGESAFTNCKSLTDLILPEGLTTIQGSAFSDCENLTNVSIPSSLKTISDFAFNNCVNLSNVVMVDGLNEIGGMAFGECQKLEEIKLPNSLVHIAENAFYNCTGLKKIVVPDKVSSIGDNAFSGCQELQFAYLPTSLKNIGKDVFEDCHKDFTIFTSIKEKPTNWDDNWCNGFTVFWNYECDIDKMSHTVENIAKMKNAFADRFVFNLDCTEIIKYIEDDNKDVIIPHGIVKIGTEAFKDCNKISTITIPDSVTTIEKGAFAGCKNLYDVILSNNLQKIEDEAFLECRKLEKISIPESVTSIGDSAFKNCINLDIRVPTTVKNVAFNAFAENKREHKKSEARSSRIYFRMNLRDFFDNLGGYSILIVTFILTALLWFSFYYGFGTLQVGTPLQILVALGIPVTLILVVVDWILLAKKIKDGEDFVTGLSGGLTTALPFIIAMILLLWGQWNGACVIAAYVFLGIAALSLIIFVFEAKDGEFGSSSSIPVIFMVLLTFFVFFTSVVACWWNLVESNNGTSDVSLIINMLSLLIR